MGKHEMSAPELTAVLRGFLERMGAELGYTAKTLHLDREAELHGAIALASWRSSLKPPHICAPFTQILGPQMTA
ncbi:MAG: hypothetical protein LBR80_10000, partial [Deltaproteobacteria bacterium]|nr:hypothetical protein [Deltaproteobacteria bacterium]